MIRGGPARLPAVLGLFFLSGATSLVYEVVWLRLLILIFGSTVFATSAILATFMGGLALGAYLAGRVTDRSTRPPLWVYGVLEIGIGVYAVAVPTLFDLLTPAYRAVWSAGGADSPLLLNGAKLLGIAVVLLPPASLMGASLPVLARAVAGDEDRIGGEVGGLYAVNTFGAVVGTFVAGFLAIPGIGVQSTLRATAAVNLAVGIVAIALARGRRRLPARTVETPRRSAPTAAGTRLLLAAFGISGFCAMVLEVAWTRALALVLGSSVYAFSLMLLAFLLGLASGSAFFARLLRRRPRLEPGAMLVGLVASAGALAYGSAFVFQELPRLFGEIYFAWSPPVDGWFAIKFGFGLLIMFPATFAFGGVFPAVLQIHARGLDVVARSVGTVYAANTIGTIVGATAAGFVLIPALGVRNTVVATGLLELALGVVLVLGLGGLRSGTRRALAVPLIAALAVLPFVRPPWDPLLMNSGVYMNLQDFPKDATWNDFLDVVKRHTKLVYAREGMTASVLVADEPRYDNRFLAVNGKIEASTAADMETQLMVGHLPLLLHTDPHDVLVVGLASGITVGAVATHPVDDIRVVEIEPAMVPAARLFDKQNGHVLDDPRVHLSINDARNELEFSPATYDVIVSEPSNPWMTVASNLFTEDFFKMARTRLRPGGIFSQWVQNYYLAEGDLRSIVAAFHAAFPHVMTFETAEGVDLVLLGSSEPLTLDMPRIAARMSELDVRMDLARIEVRRPEDVLTLFRLGPREVDRFVAGARPNTDDNARVEFSAPRALYRQTLDENLSALAAYAVSPASYLEPRPAGADAAADLDFEVALAWRRRGFPEEAREAARKLLDGPARDRARALLEQLDRAQNP